MKTINDEEEYKSAFVDAFADDVVCIVLDKGSYSDVDFDGVICIDFKIPDVVDS